MFLSVVMYTPFHKTCMASTLVSALETRDQKIRTSMHHWEKHNGLIRMFDPSEVVDQGSYFMLHVLQQVHQVTRREGVLNLGEDIDFDETLEQVVSRATGYLSLNDAEFDDRGSYHQYGACRLAEQLAPGLLGRGMHMLRSIARCRMC